jgi:hypothetical protein
MVGPRQVEQGALFYNFSIDAHVPADHLLRSIDRARPRTVQQLDGLPVG